MEIKINEMAKAKEGDSGLEIEGKVIFSQTPKIMTFDNKEVIKQFIVIKDDTGEQGCNATLKSKEEEICKGIYIKFRGTVSKEYKDKKGNLKRSLNGYKIDEIVKAEEFKKEGGNILQEKPISQPNTQPVKQEKDMDKVWEDKDLRMARESALKNIADYVGTNLVKLEERFKYAQEDVDFIYNGLITSEDITKEFGGTAVEETKKERIAKAQEIANQASQAQKDMVEKIIKSKYITEKEIKNIGDLVTLTKDNASKYISYWFGKDEEVGERAKREIVAKDKEGNPFVTERQPIEKRDPKDDASLAKDLLLEKIKALRKDQHLEDDTKFAEAMECNANFDRWTEKDLNRLKERLEMYNPL